MTDDELELRRRAERRADAKLGFRAHLMAYVVVNAGLIAINLITSPAYFWAAWPLFGWGLGVFAHAIAVYHDGGELRERMVREELERLRR
ncbi:MAG: 2TM domain-containing protein [Phenylobacterium sp.]